MTTLITAVNQAESKIHGSDWTRDTAGAASGDISKIDKVLATTMTDLKNSKIALDTLNDALPIRPHVDDLRRKLATAERTLQGEQEQYGRAGRFGEVNDMTPADATAEAEADAGPHAGEGSGTDSVRCPA